MSESTESSPWERANAALSASSAQATAAASAFGAALAALAEAGAHATAAAAKLGYEAIRPSIEAAWDSSAAIASSVATRVHDGLANPANWPAVFFFVAALVVLRLSLRLAGGAPGARVLLLPRRLVTLVLVPALACTIAHAPYLDSAQAAAVTTYSAAASTAAAATAAALEHPRGATAVRVRVG